MVANHVVTSFSRANFLRRITEEHERMCQMNVTDSQYGN